MVLTDRGSHLGQFAGWSGDQHRPNSSQTALSCVKRGRDDAALGTNRHSSQRTHELVWSLGPLQCFSRILATILWAFSPPGCRRSPLSWHSSRS